MSLSIIIPSYNEEKTVAGILEAVFKVNFEEIDVQVIFVDDGSTDNTPSILSETPYEVLKLKNTVCSGKSAAIRRGLREAVGEYVIIQDADLELDPNDIKRLYGYAKVGDKNVVYGSRMLDHRNQEKTKYGLFYFGGIVVTTTANLLHRCNITDEPTCYKLVKRDILNELHLQEERFGFCAEVTAKVSRLGYAIPELPISYQPRTHKEGKKIRWSDGLQAVWILFKYRILPVKSWKRPSKFEP